MIAETLEQIKGMARDQALYLRGKAPEMTDTEIIAEETYIPEWGQDKDYSAVAVGSPVKDYDENGISQVYGLIQPHNASHYQGSRPKDLPALWRVKHTTDPAKAKPWVQPTSTSDLYLVGECMIWTDGLVYRSRRDTNYSPADYALDWEVVEI